jgi:cytosine/adenosine deaminase-related metal-dependent hydrolase
MRKISADFLYPVDAAPIPGGVVVAADDGTILALGQQDHHDPASLEYYRGAIVPGFINTHCHLELSHMKGIAPTGTGLLPFLKTVVHMRHFPEGEIQNAIRRADQDMYDAGIVAVGDISNKIDTAATKKASKMRYYTFVEMFDFLQEGLAGKTFEEHLEIYSAQAGDAPHSKSMVPHAPYTVSRALFRKIRKFNRGGQTVSIHNQETEEENALFMSKNGAFRSFFQSFGHSIEAFLPSGKSSIHYALENLDPECRTLFVHNTMTTAEDIQAAHAWSAQVFWATCPNANLYIENRLPNYQIFLEAGARVTIGTDSLTSNWQLSVLEEMKTIARFQSYVPWETVLQWATLHGAQALGYDTELGSISPGKRPGLNLLENLSPTGGLQSATRVRRLL